MNSDEWPLTIELVHIGILFGVNNMGEAYKRIGLLDHMGLGNLGDAAIHESFIMNIMRRSPDALLVSFSLYPNDTRYRHDIVSYPIRWCYPEWKGAEESTRNTLDIKSRLKLSLKSCRGFYALAKPVHDCIRELAHLVRSYRIVKGLDLLVIAGGGQLCDLHGELPYNVFKFCVLAKLSNTPVFIVGVGADRLERAWTRFFAKWSVRLASYVSFRSVESQHLIRKLGVKKETHVCPDPAYALVIPDYLASKRSDILTAFDVQALFRPLGCVIDPPDSVTARAANKPTLTVGLNPMGFCDPRRWPRKDPAAYLRYLDKLETFSSWLLDQNFEVELFTSEVMMDVYAIEDLKRRVRDRASRNTSSRVLVRPLLTLKELLIQMFSFDFVITSKFHGVIFSHLLAKPVIALSYLPKIDDLMRTVGHDRYCLDIEHFDVKTLMQRFELLVEEKDQLNSLFRRTSKAYAESLRSHFDNLFSAGENTGSRVCESRREGIPEFGEVQ